MEDDPAKMKQFVWSKLQNVLNEVINALEKTEVEAFYSTPLRFRFPWNVLWGDICKGGVCVAGDALHPMTPDLAKRQGYPPFDRNFGKKENSALFRYITAINPEMHLSLKKLLQGTELPHLPIQSSHLGQGLVP
ncbi:hypothetical protein MRB53_035529 [Persea americana]|uniref:Uncharacterized protein n=1 Tax=Persea americana TaxID=3435 RepID=A0ACC2K5D5_PERAE|nr:hypothetical protein MRB53_035529 [Persea americana]